MKAHYPVEFIAASMTLDLNNTDKLSEFRSEAQRLGIKVEPPNINRSGPTFGSATPVSGTVGAGLEFGFAPNWSVGVEYNHIFLSGKDVTFAGFQTDHIKQDVDMGLVRLNYKFGGPIIAKLLRLSRSFRAIVESPGLAPGLFYCVNSAS